MTIYQVFGKDIYELSPCLFSTSSKDLAERFKERAEKYLSYVSKKKSIYFELEEVILSKVQKSFSIDYSKATQADLQKINSEIDIEHEEFLKELKSSPVEQRAYKLLDSTYLDYDSFKIVEIKLSEELPELFNEVSDEEFVGDETEFLKKDFERFCNDVSSM